MKHKVIPNMKHNETQFTIEEVADISGKSKNSIYRYIKIGKLKTARIDRAGRSGHVVDAKDLESFLGYKLKHKQTQTQTQTSDSNTMKHNETQSLEETINKAIQHAIFQQTQHLVKPLEEQALFIAGKVTQENHDLREKLELIRQENELLREAMKALPGPVEKVLDELREKDQKLEEKKKVLTETESQKRQLEVDLQEKIDALVRVKSEKEQLQIQQAKVQTDLETLQKENSAYKEARAKYDELEVQLKEKEVKL